MTALAIIWLALLLFAMITWTWPLILVAFGIAGVADVVRYIRVKRSPL